MFVKCFKLLINLDRIQAIFVSTKVNDKGLNFQYIENDGKFSTETINFTSHEKAISAHYYITECIEQGMHLCDLRDHLKRDDFEDAYYT